MPMNEHPEHLLLVLNAGSSSLKFALFGDGSPTLRILAGAVERIGSAEASFTLKGADGGQMEHAKILATSHESGLEYLLQRISERTGMAEIRAIGHRVVHGGMRYRDPKRVDPEMLDELQRISLFDPEHLPAEIALMKNLSERFPALPQIACFDTAFHSAMPRVARLLPIPRRFEAIGIQRYGFHGLSYEYLMTQPGLKGRVILAHLGNGASLAAVCDGRPMDTSMAFTPTAGLPMSTRSGDLDPGIVGFLARSENMTAEQFHSMVNKQSGLLGISETCSDIRDLLAQENADVRAAEAIAVFCYQTKKWIGAYAAALGGLDVLVFTGGIGENNAVIRSRICGGLDFLGIEFDEQQNAANAAVISQNSSRVAVRIIRTDEEIVIAKAVRKFLEAL
jgi:acetate kinase